MSGPGTAWWRAPLAASLINKAVAVGSYEVPVSPERFEALPRCRPDPEPICAEYRAT